jgi:hypothetical protein
VTLRGGKKKGRGERLVVAEVAMDHDVKGSIGLVEGAVGEGAVEVARDKAGGLDVRGAERGSTDEVTFINDRGAQGRRIEGMDSQETGGGGSGDM